MSIVFSQKAIQLNYNKNVANFLGEFSMIIYFAHPIAQKIGIVYLRDSVNSISIYLFLSTVFSVILYCLEKSIKNYKKQKS